MTIFALLLPFLGTTAGCEIVATAYVEKDWRTEMWATSKPDLRSRVEVKATKLIGRDAKLQSLKDMKENRP